MKAVPLFLLTCIFPALLAAQEKKRGAFLELAGSGGFGSLNYEQQFLAKEKWGFTWRAGLSIAPIDRNNGFGIVVPLMANAVYGTGQNKLELGLGQGFTVTTKGSWFILAPALIGWRHEKNDSRFFFRLSYTPLVSYLLDFQVQQWGGCSIGYKLYKP